MFVIAKCEPSHLDDGVTSFNSHHLARCVPGVVTGLFLSMFSEVCTDTFAPSP